MDQYLHWVSKHFISAFLSLLAISSHGPSVVYLQNVTIGITSTIHRLSIVTNITTPTTVVQKTKTFPPWYPTQKALVKDSRRPAIVRTSRCTLKVRTSSKIYSWPPRIKTINVRKVG